MGRYVGPVRILGIDPGSRHTGWGAVELSGNAFRLVAYGTLDLGSKKELAVRLGRLYEGLGEVIEKVRPAGVSVESVFHAVNTRSALVLGQARGAALAAAATRGLPVYEYTPSEIKRASTGNGRAGKEQVSRMVGLLVGGNLDADEHACDALAAAICHLNRSKGRP